MANQQGPITPDERQEYRKWGAQGISEFERYAEETEYNEESEGSEYESRDPSEDTWEAEFEVDDSATGFF